jgi:hypothetical protein
MDLSVLLYLNPELVSYSNLTSLSSVASAVDADPSGSIVSLSSVLPSVPPGFDPRVYLAAQTDVSGMNETIRLAMLGIGMSEAAVAKRGTFVSTLNRDTKPPVRTTPGGKDLTFRLIDQERFGSTEVLSDSVLRPGDHVRVQRRGGTCEAMTGVVRDVRLHEFSMTPDGGERAIRSALDGSGAAFPFREGPFSDGQFGTGPFGAGYVVTGIKIWDAERQALIAYTRRDLSAPLHSDDVVPRTDFSVETYRTLYPDLKCVSAQDAYIDYRARARRGTEHRVVKASSIYNTEAPYASNGMPSSGGGAGGVTG